MDGTDIWLAFHSRTLYCLDRIWLVGIILSEKQRPNLINTFRFPRDYRAKMIYPTLN